MKKYLREVESKIKSLKNTSKPSKWKAEDYVGAGASRLTFLDIKIPLIRAAYKRGFSFSKKTADEQWEIWNYIWKNSNIFEVMLLSEFWLSSLDQKVFFKFGDKLLTWVNFVDNWAHSDGMSSHYAKLLEKNPKKYLPVYKTWSDSKNPWLRRQSLVGILYYSKQRKKPLKFKIIAGFIEKLINDEHFYVQKGIGWALRECWNVYPTQTFSFLKKNAHKIPSAGWTAATEKLSEQDKGTLSDLRKSRRGQ